MQTQRRRLVPLALAAICSLTSAQEWTHPSRDDPAIVSGVGFSTSADGRPVLVGPGYRAVFDPDRVAFHPALGTAAPTTQEVAMEFQELRIGTQLLARAGQAELVADGPTVRFEHGSGVSERYDARADGLEQSFTILERPSTIGDLVLRSRWTSTMPLIESSSDGLRFELESVGGVTIGAVTGIGADGATQPGTIRVEGQWIEYVLPAAFVAKAKFPLIVDPLFGSFTEESSGAGVEHGHSDVAADGSNFLTVWDVRYAFDDYDIHSRFVNGDGQPYTFVYPIRVTIGGLSRTPAVGGKSGTFAGFVVAWDEGSAPTGTAGIYARSVFPSNVPTFPNFVLSPLLLVTSSSVRGFKPAIGTGYDVSIIWESGAGIVGRNVRGTEGGLAPVGPIKTILPGVLHYNPAINKSDWDNGRFLVAASYWNDTTGHDHMDLEYRIVHQNLDPYTNVRRRGELIKSDEYPTVACSGERFSIFWNRFSSYGAADADIVGVEIGPSGYVWKTLDLSVSSANWTRPPSAVNVGDRTIVAWTSYFLLTQQRRVLLASVCNDTFELCSGYSSPPVPPNSEDFDPVVVADRTPDPSHTSLNGLVTWTNEDPDVSSSESIFAQPWSAFEPWSVTSLGGACGTPISVNIEGPTALGNSEIYWAVDVGGFGPNVLIMNAKANAGPPHHCGSCALQLDLGAVQMISPVQGGFMDVFHTPIPGDPSLYGTVVTTQFFAFPSTGAACPSLSSFSASDRLQFAITR